MLQSELNPWILSEGAVLVLELEQILPVENSVSNAQ